MTPKAGTPNVTTEPPPTTLREVRRRRARGRWAVAALVVTTLVVAFHVFHTWVLKRLIVSAQDDVFVEWSSLSSWWPGRAHVRGYRMRFREPDIDVFVALDEADVVVDLWALFHKTFRATKVRGRGLVMRIRPRTGADDVAGLPDIPGLPALRPPPEAEPKPDVPDSKYDKWTVDLRDVEVSGVHEVWVERFRVLDATHVAGQFFLRPKRLLTLAPSRLEFAPADPARHTSSSRLHIAGRAILDSLSGAITVAIDGHDPRHGEVLKALSGRLELRGVFNDLQTLRTVFPPTLDPQLLLEGGTGKLDLALGLDHGRLTRGTRTDLWLEDSAISVANAPTPPTQPTSSRPGPSTGTLSPLAGTKVAIESAHALAHEVDEHTLRMRLSMVGLRATRPGQPGSADVAQLAVEGRVQDLDFGRPTWISGGVVSLDVPALILSDVRLLGSYLPRATTVRLLGGSMRVRCRADVGLNVEGNTLTPNGQAEVVTDSDRVRVRLLDSGPAAGSGGPNTVEFEGKIHSELRLRGLSLAGAQSLQGHVALTEVLLRARGSSSPVRSEPWWAQLQLDRGQLVAFDPELPVRMEVSAKVRDIRPMFDVFAIRGDVPQWVGDVVGLEGLMVTARLSVGATAVNLPQLSAHSGAWTMAGRLWHRNGNTRAIAKIALGPLALGLQSDREHTGVQLAGVDAWFAQNEPRFQTP